MITSDLVSYIKKQLQSNIPEDVITSKLVGIGWLEEDINEGLSKAQSEITPQAPSVDLKKEIPVTNTGVGNQPSADKYRESLGASSTAETKTETPHIDIKKPEPKKEEHPKMDTSKAWIPRNVPVRNVSEPLDAKPSASVAQSPKTEKEELIPNLMPKSAPKEMEVKKVDNAVTEVVKPKPEPEVMPKKEESVATPPQSVPPTVAPKMSSIKDLSKKAMLSSYQRDVMSVRDDMKDSLITPMVTRKSKKKKVIIIALILIVVGAGAILGGLINTQKISNFFIKKDPRILLLNNSKNLSLLKSYKTNTSIKISAPSFYNITNSLISGEEASALDKDYVSIDTLGMINKNNGNVLSDNSVTIKSSLIKNSVVSRVVNDGMSLFIAVPNLSGVVKDKLPESSVVKVDESQYNLVFPLFQEDVELVLNKINIYKILSSGISPYFSDSTLNSYYDFIDKTGVTEKGEETVKGIDTYHYSINIDQKLAKDLLTEITNNFASNISSEDQNKLSVILGSATVDSFDVWVGKVDNTIYQFSVVIDTPLSKVIGFEDKSIGNNKVTISWTTTYYDFNTNNNIIVPNEYVNVVDFVNTVKQERLKSNVSSLKEAANSLKNAEGNYGSKSNTSGDCMNPSSGSLFSPLGHTKGSSVAISSISELLNKVLNETKGNGSCYSTSKAWSFAVPLANNYDPQFVPEGGYQSFFCVDSLGKMSEVSVAPTSVSCVAETDTTKKTN